MHTYWINIENQVARKDFMMQQFSDFKYSHTRIDAYTPNTMPPIKKPPNCTRNAQEYACLASHLKVFQEAQKDEHNVFTVMEDDIVIPFQINWLKLLKTTPADWEILQLHMHHRFVIPRLYKNRYRRGKLWFPWNRKHCSTGVYIIKKTTSTKILNLFVKYNFLDFSKLKYPVVADLVLYRSAKTYSLTYPLFFSNVDFNSTIHQEHMGWRKEGVANILAIQKNRDEPSFIHPFIPRKAIL